MGMGTYYRVSFERRDVSNRVPRHASHREFSPANLSTEPPSVYELRGLNIDAAAFCVRTCWKLLRPQAANHISAIHLHEYMIETVKHLLAEQDRLRCPTYCPSSPIF